VLWLAHWQAVFWAADMDVSISFVLGVIDAELRRWQQLQQRPGDVVDVETAEVLEMVRLALIKARKHLRGT
jgi:hypothetical protein